MEETLRQLQKEAAGGRHRALRDACGSALETLKAARGTDRIPTCRLRQQCVCALQMALETKSTRLVQTALTGMQKLVSESRFLTEEAELEAEPEAEQPLSQMLEALRVTPELQEDLQVEVMKVLLCLTYCSTFHLNARNVLRIAQVCIQTYVSSGHQRSINTAVRATLSQVLGDLTLQLHTPSVDGDESLTFSHQPSKDASAAHEAVCEDVIRVLAEFCDRLESESDGDQLLQLLYLECVLSVLSNCPPTMHLHRRFTDIVWKQLCPTLVVILGNPASDKGVTSAQAAAPQEGEAACVLPDQGRGSGCSSGALALTGPVARTLCYVAAELVRLVGSVESLKPVLQSLYHRLLLYPPPQHRLEALRIMKEMLASPQRLFDLAGPYVSEPDTRKKSFSRRRSHLDLLKLIMDGISETCLKGGMEACYCAVSCAHGLLGALDELSRGRGLLPAQSRLLTGRLEELAEGAESMREAVEVNEDDFRWQRDVLSSENPRQSPDISISVTAVEGHGSPDDAPQSTAPPDVVQRGHGPTFPDITNFLTVETRTRSHGSRYSESNFSAEEQELSRTEFDSCDQYSMAAEKDSGRSDVSDMGSDQCSLADEEQTPQDCLRGAALSLKLLRNQEADQRSARMFVDALAALLPRLLGPDAAADVDVSLQNFSSTFCSGLHAGGVDSPGLEASENMSCQALMNADGLYLVSYYALLLNLKLCCSDFYHRKPASPPVSLKEFVRQIQSSGVLVVLSQAWIEELYSQVMERNLLGEAGYWGSEEDQSLPLITLLTDIEGLGSRGIGGQLMRKSSEQSPFSCGRSSSDVVVLAGVVFARYILTGCWKNLIDVLSVPLTGRMAGSSRALSFILGAEGVKEQSQRERDAICLSLDGLRKAAALSCVLGVAANCASALAQMAAASCVQEVKEAEAGDALTQVKQKLEQMSRAPSLRLHTAHVLCMDAILNAGLEMGSHNPDCWTHVFRVVEYVSSLEHSHFSDGVRQPPVTLAQAQAEPGGDLIQPRSIQQLLKENPHGKELLTGGAAARAVCALSTQADRLFEDAVAKLNLVALVDFLHQLRKASQSQLFDSVTETGDYSLAMPGEARSTQEKRSALHLFRLGDAMLLIVKNQPERPLLHVMRAWSVVAPHLVEASCHKERHVSQKAVSFIHDVLLEVLSRWAEPPHFHFSEALFRPFEHIMQLELCDEDVQDQVVASVGELVETCSLQIRSGWRPLFSALRTVHGAEAKDYLTGAYRVGKSQAPVFDVFQAFISTDNIQVFANAATDYIMCLMKFVKGLGELDYKEIGDCVHVSGYSSTDLCLPALDYLRKCSQLLARIYKMPSKPVFLGARLASLPVRVHERSVSSEDGLDDVLAEFDDDTGLIQVWILLLEQLTAAVSNCPRQHQPLTLELLFELLRDITTTPGPGFALFSVVQLLLPIMSLWLQRSHGDHCYWDVAAANFKHAIGLSCELAVEHIHSFIHSDMGYESLMNVMLKDLLKLLVACVAEPAESISRVGCSCIRYVLVSAGPVFTEEMWRLACRALQDAFSATLQPAKKLLARFRSGSGGDSSSTGDACEVKVAAASRSPSADAEYTRIRAMAQQVFMLDTQCSPKTPGGKDGFEHAQSCVLILDVPTDLAHRSIPFRTLVVSLLSHQVLLQNLHDVLIEGPARSTPGAEPQPAGFLRFISMQNLAIIFDLLLDSYRTSREFDSRPGLKYLLMKVSGMCVAANLYRQSALSFNIYFQALLCALLGSQENITAEQVKKVLSEEEECGSDSSRPCSSEDEDIFEEMAQVSPPRARQKRQWPVRVPSLSTQPLGGGDWAWLLRRLHRLCADLCDNYVQMHLDLENSVAEQPPSHPAESSAPSLSGRATPCEDSFRLHLDVAPSEKQDAGGRREWWESKLSTIATDRTIAKLMEEYKKHKQQQQQQQGPVEAGNPERPRQLLEQGAMRHSVSAGPELLRPERRPRSASLAFSHTVLFRDSEAQIQAWTNMVLTILNQILLLPDATFTALQCALFPCVSQLTCHVTDLRVRQAVRDWLGRVGRVYDITL